MKTMLRYPVGLMASLLLAGCANDLASVGPIANPGAAPTAPALRVPRALADRIWLPADREVVFPLLANDEVNGGALVELPEADQAHGTVSVSPDGMLTYTPKPSANPLDYKDTFRYTIANSAGRSTATVTVYSPPAVYVDNRAGGGGNGSKNRPFNTLDSALKAANGQPRRFLVAVGDGTSNGLGDTYVLSPGQAILGPGPNNRPFLTGKITMSDETGLENLSLGIADPGGSVLATDASDLELQNVNFADQGALAPAMILTRCSGISLTDVNFANCPRDAVQFVDAIGAVALNRVGLDRVGGSVLFQNSRGPIAIDLNKLTFKDTDQPIQILFHDTAGQLNSQDCQGGEGASQLLTVDLSGQSGLQARLQGWQIPILSDQSRLFRWHTREQSDCVLQVLNWRTADPSHLDPNDLPVRTPVLNPIEFTVQDGALGGIVFNKCQFHYSNPVNLLATDSAQMFVRMENYRTGVLDFFPDPDRDWVPVNLSGRNSAKAFARFDEGSEVLVSDHEVGIRPVFDFQDSSLATIVRLFGQASHFGQDVLPDWEWDNGKSTQPVLNGQTIFLGLPADLPNYKSVPDDNIGIPKVD